MNNMGIYWIIAGSILLLCEMGHPGLFLFLSGFFGSLAGLIAYFFELSITMQLTCSFIAALVSFVILLQYKNKLEKKNSYRSNMYALQGKHGIAISAVQEQPYGQVKLGGQIWSATTLPGEYIPAGTGVEVIQVIGCHLVVKTIKHIS